MKEDTRKVIGTSIIAKAIHVTNAKTCMAVYGSEYKKKEVQGKVTAVNYLRKTDNGPAQCYITATYIVGTRFTKSVQLHLSKVKAVVPPEATINMNNDPFPSHDVSVVDDNNNASIEAPTIDVANEGNKEDDDDYNDAKLSAMTTTQLEARLNTLLDSPTVEIPAIPTAAIASSENTTPTETSPPTTPIRPKGLYNDDSPVTKPAARANNGKEWYDMPHQILLPLNGRMASYEWGLKLPTGEIWRENANTDETIQRLDVFLQLFPTKALNNLHIETNNNIRCNNYNDYLTTKTELLRFIGIILLATKYDWNDRADLWSTTNPSKYVNAINFGKLTNMSRNRFDFLWKHMRFSHQPQEIPEGMSSTKYRWMLVDDFVEAFNSHRSVFFIPGDSLCVDESFSRWYGKGGSWINIGLPLFIVMDRKPDDGCELWSCCCGTTGVMLQLMVVKSEEDRHSELLSEKKYNHGTTILSSLTSSWTGSKRLVVADSYFSSVEAATLLKECNLNFIGVVKTSTKGYPMDYMKRVELHEKGDRVGLLSKDIDGNPELLAFVLRDRDRRYFISNCSSLAEGKPVSRERWRQMVKDNVTPPEKVHVTFPQPQAADLYYESCAKIDQHNRDRQATLGIERKFKTHDWSKRVNLTILSMCIVDSWKVWSSITKSTDGNPKETQKDFYGHLAAELIDNKYDGVQRRVIAAGEGTESGELVDVRNPRTGEIRRGLDIHLTPTKRKRITNGVETKHAYQGRCNVCQKKTMLICSCCDDDSNIKNDVYICDPRGGTKCWPFHITSKHN